MPSATFPPPAALWEVPTLLVAQHEPQAVTADLGDEFGMCGQLQRWVRTLLMAETHIQQASRSITIEDEGNFEAELERNLSDIGLAVVIATPSWQRISMTEVQCEIAIKVAEVVVLNRNRGGTWATALRMAELCMGAIEGQARSENGWSPIVCRSNILESQTPWLVYRINATTRTVVGVKGVRT